MGKGERGDTQGIYRAQGDLGEARKTHRGPSGTQGNPGVPRKPTETQNCPETVLELLRNNSMSKNGSGTAPEQLRNNSGTSPEHLRNNSGTTPEQLRNNSGKIGVSRVPRKKQTTIRVSRTLRNNSGIFGVSRAPRNNSGTIGVPCGPSSPGCSKHRPRAPRASLVPWNTSSASKLHSGVPRLSRPVPRPPDTRPPGPPGTFPLP